MSPGVAHVWNFHSNTSAGALSSAISPSRSETSPSRLETLDFSAANFDSSAATSSAASSGAAGAQAPATRESARTKAKLTNTKDLIFLLPIIFPPLVIYFVDFYCWFLNFISANITPFQVSPLTFYNLRSLVEPLRGKASDAVLINGTRWRRSSCSTQLTT
ncbi:hypothetical protein ES703_110758 [subsurface metagenome]